MAKIEMTGGRLHFKVGASDKLYVKREVGTETKGDIRERCWVPSPLNGTLPRLMTDSLVLHEFTAKSGVGRVTFSCKAGEEFIPVFLSRNERIVISLSHMVGFTSNVKFTSYANLSLATITCDRTFATIVSGPGTIVFKSSGNHTISHTEVNKFDPERLIAWAPSTQFRFEPIQGWADLYLRGRIKLSCRVIDQGAMVVLDSEAKRLESDRGGVGVVGRFLRSVYLPRLF